jgi:hypothetical protein
MAGRCPKDVEVKCAFSIGGYRVNMKIRFEKGDRIDELIDKVLAFHKIPLYLGPTFKNSIQRLFQQRENKLYENEAGKMKQTSYK